MQQEFTFIVYMSSLKYMEHHLEVGRKVRRVYWQQLVLDVCDTETEQRKPGPDTTATQGLP